MVDIHLEYKRPLDLLTTFRNMVGRRDILLSLSFSTIFTNYSLGLFINIEFEVLPENILAKRSE